MLARADHEGKSEAGTIRGSKCSKPNDLLRRQAVEAGRTLLVL